MISQIIILAILLIGIYSGGRRGFILQVIHTIGYFATVVIASIFYESVAKILEMIIPYPSDTVSSQLALYNLVKDVEFDKTFYKGIAFLFILLIGWLLTRLIGVSLNKVSHIPIVYQMNWIGGAILGFMTNWIGLFFILTALSVIPLDSVQQLFSSQSLATFIVKQTPIMSDYIMNLWLTYK